ncbi:MAG: DUF6340 family protein [Bacteroidales bacterium]|nr:DUF6340 family protein [Bacteroidales bacterium]
MNLRALYTTLLVGFLISCETTSVITLEVKRPAEIELPDNISKIVIVDNTVPQPANFGHSMFTFKVRQESPSYDALKLNESFVDELANKINGTHSLKASLKRMNNKKSFTDESSLSSSQIQAIADSTGAEMLISIDRIQINSVLKMSYVANENLYRVTLDGRNFPQATVYNLKTNTKIATLNQQDSLYWENFDMSSELAFSRFPSPISCLNDMMTYSADKLYRRIFPNQEFVQRNLYFTQTSNMLDALKYAKQNRWQEASYIWEYEFNQSKSKRIKAYCAANLALYSEIMDQFDAAISWAEQSKSIFQNSNSMNLRSEISKIDLYIKDLNVRNIQVTRLAQQDKN